MSAAVEAPEGRAVRVGELEIFYRELGAGPPLLMLHGTGPGASGWANFSSTAEAFADRYRVIVPDLPRYGRSSKIAIAGPRLTVLSRHVDGFLEAISADRVHVIGNSMGGQVAMKLAIDRPERVDRLVVMGSPPLGPSVMGPSPAESIRLIEAYYKGDGPSRDKMRQLIRSMVYDPRFATDERIEERYLASIDPEVIAANAGPAWEKETLEGQLDRLTSPVLVVWGQDDRAASLDVGLRLVRQLPNGRMVVFSHCGHWAHIERAAEFNALVGTFLAAEL